MFYFILTLTPTHNRAPEILFKPELIGRDHYGMHESLFKSILSSDIDLRRSFLENIVLSGNRLTFFIFLLFFFKYGINFLEVQSSLQINVEINIKISLKVLLHDTDVS